MLGRREFLTAAGALLGAAPSFHPRSERLTPKTQPQNTGELAKMSSSPQPRGVTRYTVRVPDTLDLAERAGLAINALTRLNEPRAEYAVYFYVHLGRNPPVMTRPIPLYGKFMEGLALMRRITGSDQNAHVDRHWREAFLRLLETTQPVLQGPEGGRQLAWLAFNARFERDERWRQVGEAAVKRMAETAAYRENYAYLPHPAGTEFPTGWEATGLGWTLQGLSQFALATGSPAARELGGKLARYLKDHAQVFDRRGHFLARHPSAKGPALHFHHNANALLGLLEYALAGGDPEYAAFARQGYEYVRSLSEPLIGFAPEYIEDWPDDRPIIDCEGCCVADIIELALGLSRAGQGDYWDDVDRYVRNQFAEMQMRQSDWIERTTAGRPLTPVQPGECADHVPERCVGAFAGWALANDFYGGYHPGIQNCCTGNGARALYFVWEQMLHVEHQSATVHLLLNRASEWLDIDSYLPYTGRVDFHIKRACELRFRLPEWVKPAEAACAVNGVSRPLAFDGRYAQAGPLRPGDRLTATFPIGERTEKRRIGGRGYQLLVRGNDVISIDPAGERCPFYQRAKYRGDVQWIDRQRFVSAAGLSPG
jgi:hypothetical protein